MRYNQAEKYEIIRTVEESQLPAKQTLKELDIPASTFYGWYGRYEENGYDGLVDDKPAPRQYWNRIPDEERERIKAIALVQPEKRPREPALHITANEKS